MVALRGFAPGFGQRGMPSEKKVIDIAAANYACDTTGSVTALNLVAIGDDYTNRDGRMVTIKSAQVRGVVRQVDATCGPVHCRVLLIWDMQPKGGAIATIAEILSAATSQSFINLTNRFRFKVLRDQSFALGQVDNTATQSYNISIPQVLDWFVPLTLVTQYGGTGATIGDIQEGALLLVTIGDQAAGGGGQLNATTRVRFIDH